MKSYIINFIRHGLTEANTKALYAGFLDIPVCEKGLENLKNLRESYEYPTVQRYYSSSLSRCVQTCKVIYPDANPILVDGLKECNFGDWEGKTFEELAYCKENIEWMKRGNDLVPPNGEGWREFADRIASSFEKIVDELIHDGVTSSAIFTHGGVIMTILSKYGLPREKYYKWLVDNGCGYSVRVTPSLWMRDKVFEIEKLIPYGISGELSEDVKRLVHGIDEAE